MMPSAMAQSVHLFLSASRDEVHGVKIKGMLSALQGIHHALPTGVAQLPLSQSQTQ